MEFKNIQTVSEPVKEQIRKLCEIWKSALGSSLHGIYLHGSMALNCFVESSSDLDFLIITDRKIPREERIRLAKEIIAIDQLPCSLEMSALYLRDIQPWHYPARCQFHYSDFWTERYQQMISGEMKDNFIVDTDFEDPDIACHVRLTRQCGICLFGQPITSTFPEVPEADFWNSISADVEDYDFSAYNPKYFVSNILILGRILSYKAEKRILSKYEGGVWTQNHVPEQYRYIIENALGVWYDGKKQLDYNKEDLENLRKYLIDCIKTD